MGQLKAKNPQMFQQIMTNQNNPQELFNKITGNYTPNQIQNIKGIARNFGIPDTLINQYFK